MRLHRPTPLRSLLVPVDLAPITDRILARLALLPLDRNARITILHVVPPTLPITRQRDAEREARRLLGNEARHLRDALSAKASVQPQVVVGAAAKEIGKYAREMKAQMIVMGRGGARTLRDEFLGSTAERVIRHARLPVLVVRLPARAPYSRPAIALDIDEAASEVVRLMFTILPPPRPPIAVIHAYDIPYRGLIYSSIAAEQIDELEEDFRLKASAEVGKLISIASAKALGDEQQPSWTMHVKLGAPRIVVRNEVKKVGTDLLILGTRGHTYASYAFLGTVSGDLLRTTKCDVLVVPPVRRA